MKFVVTGIFGNLGKIKKAQFMETQMSCSILLTYRSTCSGRIRHIVHVFKIQVCLLSDNGAAYDVPRRRLNSVGPIQLTRYYPYDKYKSPHTENPTSNRRGGVTLI